MRSISRVADVSINTVSKLLVDAGNAAIAIHNETVQGITASRVQCNEIWPFCYSKAKNVKSAKAASRKVTARSPVPKFARKRIRRLRYAPTIASRGFSIHWKAA